MKRISITINENVLNKLDERGARSTIITRDLDRLYSLYSRALAQVDLTVNEACLIADSLNGVLIDISTLALLWANVEDSIKYSKLDTKWEVDGQALIGKLQNLNELQALAILDATERFWNSEDNADVRKVAAKCFLIRE